MLFCIEMSLGNAVLRGEALKGKQKSLKKHLSVWDWLNTSQGPGKALWLTSQRAQRMRIYSYFVPSPSLLSPLSSNFLTIYKLSERQTLEIQR